MSNDDDDPLCHAYLEDLLLLAKATFFFGFEFVESCPVSIIIDHLMIPFHHGLVDGFHNLLELKHGAYHITIDSIL